jgi:7-cyano-7-deazaguanine synthase
VSGIDESGAIPLRGRACVLLSGGMDSTVCLFWAMAKYREVRAVCFDYGQPHRDAELIAARGLVDRHGVILERVVIADALHGGLLRGVPEHEAVPAAAIHRAFVPGRNLVFLSLANARANIWWPDERVPGRRQPQDAFDLVMGCTIEDTRGFPDCTDRFLKSASDTLSASVERPIRVAAPYVKMTKIEMLRDAELRFGSSLAEVQASWSCYEGKGPCGKCTACVLRAEAFAAVGLLDLCAAPQMTGGDVDREARLKG